MLALLGELGLGQLQLLVDQLGGLLRELLEQLTGGPLAQVVAVTRAAGTLGCLPTSERRVEVAAAAVGLLGSVAWVTGCEAGVSLPATGATTSAWENGVSVPWSEPAW